MAISVTSLLLLACFASELILEASSQRGVRLGSFRTLQHDVSGVVYAVDEKTFFIENFRFDGGGADVFVYVYRKGVEVDRRGGGISIYWSMTESMIPNRRFSGEDVTVSLLNRPNDGLLISDLRAITIWCAPFRVFFGTLDIPADRTTSLPPGLQMSYCIQPHEDLQLTIGYDDNNIRIRQCGCVEENEYMAFGISGDDTRTNMVGADVVVTWIDDDGPQAIDYYLTGRVQCRGGQGVCPDTLITEQTGTQDVTMIAGDVTNDQRCVEYQRPLNSSDPLDRNYLINRQSQFVVWAIGPRATEEGLMNLAFFHTEYPRNGENFMLDFATGTGSANLQCQADLQCREIPSCPAWQGQTIVAKEPTTFTVKIGLSGGLRGYQAITGLSGWGIAMYINDTLIPALRLERNVTYTFIVEAGNNVTDPSNYHPFYITDSIDGGIILDTPELRLSKNEQVYAGYDTDSNDPTAAGRLCRHVETERSGAVATNCNSRLEDYLDTLSVSCEGDESEAAILTWTPDENTPDVVYYQCANHIHLGWRIMFVDEVEGSGGANHMVPSLTATIVVIAIVKLFVL